CAKYDAKPQGEDLPGEAAGFRVIAGYGKTLSAVKVFPTTRSFTAGQNAPCLEYRFAVREAGAYEVELYLQPSNPVATDNTLYYGIQANNGKIAVVNSIPPGYKVGESAEWAAGVLDNIRRSKSEIICTERLNTLKIYAVSPGFVLEKLVIYPAGKKPPVSYLGPPESYYIGKTKAQTL
ncbi:MAG TPA: alpha-glucuronidase, partial [Bacilli bacterium]